MVYGMESGYTACRILNKEGCFYEDVNGLLASLQLSLALNPTKAS